MSTFAWVIVGAATVVDALFVAWVLSRRPRRIEHPQGHQRIGL